MATNLSTSFSVTYANVPLLLDEAKVIRQPPPEIPYGQVDRQTATRKQQPEVDIIDEINRLLDMGYLQDFYVPHLFHNRNLGAIARPSNFGPQPGPQVHIGDFYYPTGATRWAVYRGLATSTMVKTLLSIVGVTTTYVEGFGFAEIPAWVPATFTMQQVPTSPEVVLPELYSISTLMYMLPPRPLAEVGGGLDGLYLITLVCDRFAGQFRSVSFGMVPGDIVTWDDAISTLAFRLNITISYSPIHASYGRPARDSQLWMNQENGGAILDAVAANLGRVVIRNLDGTYTLQTYEEAQDWVILNRGEPAEAVVRFAGGDLFNSGNQLLKAGDLRAAKNAVVPSNVRVTFPKYIIGNDPVPHFYNDRNRNPRDTSWYETSYSDVYTIDTPIQSGGPLVQGINGLAGADGVPQFVHTIHTTAKALYSGEVQAFELIFPPLNASGGFVSGGWTPGLALLIAGSDGTTLGYDAFGGLLGAYPIDVYTSGITSLSTLASRIAIDYYYGQTLEALDESYPGIYAWTPEGFHDIIWRYSARSRQATTRVMKRQWNTVVREMQHETPLIVTNYVEGFGNLISPIASVPGCGGLSVAQTWRDSVNYTSGAIQTTLSQTFLSGNSFVALADISFLPTQNRWKVRISSGQLDDEIMLLEGTSGGLDSNISVTVAMPGMDGSFPNSHDNGASVMPLAPDVTYGINLVTVEKNQFVFPQELQSGGITGIRIVPQMQPVYNYDNSGFSIGGLRYSSGVVLHYNVTQFNPILSSGSPPYVTQEYVWLQETNNFALTSGGFFLGMLAGYSYLISGHTNPVYLVQQIQPQIPYLSSTLGSDFTLSTSWQDIGISLTLPANSTWQIQVQVNAEINSSATGEGDSISIRLYDGSSVAGCPVELCDAICDNITFVDAASIVTIYVVGNTFVTLDVQGILNSATGSTGSVLSCTSTTGTTIVGVRLA